MEGMEETSSIVCTGTGEDLVALWSHNLSNMHVGSMWRESLHCGIEAHEEESPSLEKSGGAGEVTVLCILTAVTPAPSGQVVLSTSKFIFLHLYLTHVQQQSGVTITVLPVCNKPCPLRVAGVGMNSVRSLAMRCAGAWAWLCATLLQGQQSLLSHSSFSEHFPLANSVLFFSGFLLPL